MNDNKNADNDAAHLLQVEAVMVSVFKLFPTLASKGFTPEAIFEGAIKGAAMVMITGRDLGASEIAELLADFAAGFRSNPRLDRGKLHVVE